MISNHLLEEKYKAQKYLDDKANHNLSQYFQNSHKNVIKIFKKYGIKLNYGSLTGGFLKPDHKEFGHKATDEK